MTIKWTFILGLMACSGFTIKGKNHLANEPCQIQKQSAKKGKDSIQFVTLDCVIKEGWDTTAQVAFWRRLIKLSPDSSLANTAYERCILGCYPRSQVLQLESRNALDSFKSCLYTQCNIDPNKRIFFTAGKQWFYDFDAIAPKLGRAIKLFDSFGVDPFLAQCVLLIESPKGNLRSEAGAYGQFQLMPYVARSYGLKVNGYQDERANFDRSAYASAQLFKQICIPYAERWAEEYGINPEKDALWMKLLALHIYHAGAGTVKGAMKKLPPGLNGSQVIRALWKTEAGYFTNAAQNYSQIALATYIEFSHWVSAIHK